jgi:hypothetical protein
MMIKLSNGALNISDYLVRIINRTITNAEVPKKIKRSKVIQLAEVDKPTGPSQLRPIQYDF